MMLKFTGPQDALSEEFRSFVQARCVQVVVELEGLAEHISLIHVVADDDYGAAIKEIDPEASFTNNGLFTGAAITLRSKDEGGEVRCSIVFRLSFLHHLWTEATAEPDPRRWSPLSHSVAAMIHHEFGHCVDYVARARQARVDIWGPDKRYEAAQVARYYAAILESEFAACVLGAGGASAEALAAEVEKFPDTITKLRRDAWALAHDHAATGQKWDHTACLVAGVPWTVLVEFSKIVGMRLGNPALGADELEVESFYGDEKILAVLNELEARLIEHWKAYPAWDAAVPAFMLEAWEALMKIEGFAEVFDGGLMALPGR